MIYNSKNISIFAAANAIGVWCSWLAFLHGVQAVARSSRATPTIKRTSFFGVLYFCILYMMEKNVFFFIKML